MHVFARRTVVLVAFAAVAWTRPRVASAECALASAEARTRAAEGLTEAFEAAGFEVARGAMWIFGHRDIDPDCEDCYYANPTSTYGCPMLVRRDATNGDARARGPTLPHPPSPTLSDSPSRTTQGGFSAPARPPLAPRRHRPIPTRTSPPRGDPSSPPAPPPATPTVTLDPAPSSARRGELLARRTSARTRSSALPPRHRPRRSPLFARRVAGARNIARRRRR